MDEIEIASQIAVEVWNKRVPDYPAKIVIKKYYMEGNAIVADAYIFFKDDLTCMDGDMIVGDNRISWNDPISFVYGWLECIEECFHGCYE
ncbi:hypothetical protein DEEACLCL_00170 [Salmonella phage CRW-SP2]|nr:hypothetical protein DEEACLCL_00170 [Salmonella phage CRW-SP2]